MKSRTIPSAECGEGMDWSSLRKTTIDNMTDYLARKEERIRQKTKPPTVTSHTPDTTTPQPPPDKKIKTQVVT